MPQWSEDILDCGPRLVQTHGLEPGNTVPHASLAIDERGVIRTPTREGQDIDFHLQMDQGAILRQLQYQPLHLCYWETNYYKKTLTKFLNGIDLRNTTALDVGCGDGRFTEQLIELGVPRVVATDIDIRPLHALAAHADKQGFQDRLLLIQCSADAIPLQPASIDVALSIGVLYYLNDRFEAALDCLASLLRPAGVMIDSEPDIQGAALKSLCFESVQEYLEVFETRTFTEACKGKKSRFRAFTPTELRRLYAQAGFDVLDNHGLSLIPSILRIAMVRGLIPENDVSRFESRVRTTFDYLDDNGTVAKHIIWKLQKRPLS